jgi:hypothetical protein
MAIADISPLIDTSLDLLELRHRRRESAIHQLAQCAFERQAVRHVALLETSLLRRERLGSTALGRGHVVTGTWSWCVRVVLVGCLAVLIGTLPSRMRSWSRPCSRRARVEELHFRRMEAVNALGAATQPATPS